MLPRLPQDDFADRTLGNIVFLRDLTLQKLSSAPIEPDIEHDLLGQLCPWERLSTEQFSVKMFVRYVAISAYCVSIIVSRVSGVEVVRIATRRIIAIMERLEWVRIYACRKIQRKTMNAKGLVVCPRKTGDAIFMIVSASCPRPAFILPTDIHHGPKTVNVNFGKYWKSFTLNYSHVISFIDHAVRAVASASNACAACPILTLENAQ